MMRRSDSLVHSTEAWVMGSQFERHSEMGVTQLLSMV
jgi:hypothetical protein